MKKIVLFLSGKWTPSISKIIRPGDILLCASGMKPDDNNIEYFELSKSIDEHEREITDWLTKTHAESGSTPPAQHVECFLNDFYNYSLKPLIEIIINLKQWIDETKISEIIVIAPKPMKSRIPMTGFQTTESTRGSINLLNSRLTHLLPTIFPEVNFRYQHVRGDPLCFELFRIALIGSANIFFSILLGIKIALINLHPNKSHIKKPIKSIIIVRNEHQARFACRLIVNTHSVAVAILPQATQGSLKSLFRLKTQLSTSFSLCRINPLLVSKAAARTLVDVVRLWKYSKSLKTSTLRIGGLNIPLRMSDIANEVNLTSVTLFYKNIVSELLKSTQASKLVNFELVGRMAGLEAMAANENGAKNHSIQTALIASRPHPIFPYSDFFHTDSATTLDLIKNNGSKACGEIFYSGPPYSIKEMHFCNTFLKVAFFSQPYEPVVTIEIINALCHWARNTDCRITLRLHPRDDPEKYKSLLSDFSGILIIDKVKNLTEIIDSNDLCITRTSSVAKEALALGKPILLCLWSDFDRTIKADYILKDKNLNYCVESEEKLISLLNNPTQVFEDSQKLKNGMFNKKTISDLSAAILER